MKKQVLLIITIIGFLSVQILAQNLKPGFDKNEYIELLKLTAKHTNPEYFKNIPNPDKFKLVYRSPIMGLDNAWELWKSTDNMAAISIRGTTENTVSWLANFYAAMVPAKGELKISANETFKYELAQNPNAAVHAGWLVATAFLSKNMLPKIDSCYKAGIKEVFIVGHSQGGAIAFLMTAYLYDLQKQNLLPADIRFKTYCSAGPKPGNLFFAYAYEAMTQYGWSYNVVNAHDWVPEVPLSVQTTDDFSEVNPFRLAKGMIQKQKFPKNLALKHVYNKLDKPSRKAQKNYQKYLGDLMSKSVKKNIKDFEPPQYFQSNHYVRTGNTIVLMGDEAYFTLYPLEKEKLFQHHLPPAYLYLAGKLPETQPTPMSVAPDLKLNGTWELNYILGRKIAFEGLYPDKKPIITFDVSNKKISGNTGCNNFNGKLNVVGNKISFAEPMAMTRMICQGEGEKAFLEVLKSVDSYSVDENTLTFIMGDIATMRFVKK
ncbi:MAG: META domain-containing protein [Verrucomicrobia bacterium]|nr:META domain-containing protein [Cytophagales bacterium]